MTFSKRTDLALYESLAADFVSDVPDSFGPNHPLHLLPHPLLTKLGRLCALVAATSSRWTLDHIKLMEELVKIMPDVIDTSETTELKLADRLETAPEVTPVAGEVG
jgi:hypothetical protein